MLGAALVSLVVAAEPPVTPERDLVSGSNTAFGLEIFRRLARESPKANLAMSPHEYSVALAAVLAGARGDTATQLERLLKLTIPRERFLAREAELDRSPALVVGVEVATKRVASVTGFTPSPEFAERVQKAFHVSVDTHPDAGTPALVLDDELELAGTWLQPFPVEKTHPAEFQRLGAASVQVPMMKQEMATLAARVGDVEVVKLGYQGGGMSMVLAMPPIERFTRFVAGLDGKALTALRRPLDSTRLRLSMPKFSLKSSSEMPAPLGPGVGDYAEMGSAGPMKLERVTQTCTVGVDEVRTVAIARTQVYVIGGIRELPLREVTFNRPFVFWIQDDTTGELFFLGQFTGS